MDQLTIELINKSDHEFTDISSENCREYTWPDGSIVEIDRPQWLSVSKSGHRVLDLNGFSHFIPFGWIHLKWQARCGKPHFVK